MKIALRTRLLTGLLGMAASACWSQGATAQVRLHDCPLAGRPLSLDTALHDAMTIPRLRAAIEAALPDAFTGIPPVLASGKLPSAGTIFALRFVARTPERASRLERALAGLRLTRADELARCARYDYAPPPKLPLTNRRPALLVFDHSSGYRDDPSVAAAREALNQMADRAGWQLVFTSRPASFNQRDLAKFRAVVWNNVSGDVLTLSQRAEFERYINNGGGYVGFHGSAGDPLTLWDWYVDTLVGARFKGHPSNPQFQNARLNVEAANHPITAGLGSGWTMSDEWYSFKNNPRATGSRILLTIDEASYRADGPSTDLRMGDHPIAWTRCIGRGRMFYSAIGHLPQSYENASAMRLLKQGIDWTISGGGKRGGC